MALTRTTAFTAGAIAALVLGSGTAFAATGGKFILGQSNSAGRTTVLSNPNGTALKLNSKAGTPSIRVNRTAKVPNLNADLLDGRDQSKFALTAGRARTIEGSGAYMYAEDGVTPTFVYSVAFCPPGTQMTGGGGFDGTPDGTLWWSGQLDTGVWVAASSWTPAETSPGVYPDPTDMVIASAQCYNPRGAVPGSAYRSAPDGAAAPDLSRLVERFEAKQG